MSTRSVTRSGALRGSVRPASDKSLTHRAFLFAAMARTPSVVHEPLLGEDCRSTLNCITALGASVRLTNGSVHVLPADFRQPNDSLDCGNSGTTVRLLAGIVAGHAIDVTFTGDASLSKRPMGRIATPLSLMGARCDGERLPFRVRGGDLRSIDYLSPVASAQVKSCILLAGTRASGTTWVSEPVPSRDHTERMLRGLGVPLLSRCDGGVGIDGGAVWDGFEVTVPGDISTAAFLMVAAAIVPGSELQLTEVGTNPTRTGILDVFAQAGVEIEREDLPEQMGEPIANLMIRFTKDLAPFEISGDMVPRLIDEIPVLAVLATQCQGRTIIRDAGELRVKESDRIAVVTDGLARMGATITATEDGMIIEGPSPLHATEIDARGDHRIAMAFAVAGMIAEGSTTLHGVDSIETSNPHFWSDLEALQS